MGPIPPILILPKLLFSVAHGVRLQCSPTDRAGATTHCLLKLASCLRPLVAAVATVAAVLSAAAPPPPPPPPPRPRPLRHAVMLLIGGLGYGDAGVHGR